MFSKLQTGDTIGIFSPSSPASVTSQERYERAKRFLESKGFCIKEGTQTGKQDYYRSGTPKERADELNLLIGDKNVKMIMSMIGGTNSNSILPYIDYELFQKNPKIVVGYSDATAILLALYAKTDISTFYGPALVPSFGEFDPLVQTTYSYFEQMFVQKPTLPYQVPMPPFWSDEAVNWETKTTEKKLYQNKWVCVQEGRAGGRLIGGNLNAMYGFIGTPYMPSVQDGDILLIEDCMKDTSIIEKNFAMLKAHGILDKVGGIILGKHELYDDLGTGRKPHHVLLEILNERPIPILAEFDTCHTHPMHAMPLGKKGMLDATQKSVTIEEDWLNES